MLFNSYSFLLLFLPIVLSGFFLTGKYLGRRGAILWLTLASIAFYASWEPGYTWLLLISIGINYSLSCLIQRQNRLKALAIATGITFNVLLLTYYKIIISGLFSGEQHLSSAFSTSQDVLIPLGISFITFQQIAYLVDIYKNRIQQRSFIEYCLFITFFPQLVMGPIVHYRELVPQLLHKRFLDWDSTNFTLGLAIFTVGLFKKVVLGDGISPYVNEIYSIAQSGAHISMIDAWCASLGFTFQIYFDFSGYADMAIGLARMFNINLPLNFDSPYRAVDRFDVWRRWHISFSSFMRQYVYFPLARSKRLKIGSVMALLLTAMLSGFWHGLGWTFILWGSLQGLIMAASHYKRIFQRRWRKGLPQKRSGNRWFAISTTFFMTLGLGVIFRSKDLETASNIFTGMMGRDLIGLPLSIVDRADGVFGTVELLHDGVGLSIVSIGDIFLLSVMVIIIWGFPNTRSIFRKYWTAIDQRKDKTAMEQTLFGWHIYFKPNALWAFLFSLMLVASFIFMDGTSRFIYYQF